MELTPATIKRASGHFDLSCVTHLDLSRAEITQLAHLDACVGLVDLRLTGNLLKSLVGLPPLASLRVLHLGANRLTSLDDLPVLSELEELIVSENEISSVDVDTLARKLPRLRTLDIQGNPVSPIGGPAPPDLIGSLRRALPGLVLLNGEILALAQLVRPLLSSPAASSFAVTRSNEMSTLAPRTRDHLESSQLSPFNVQVFIARETRSLEDLLAQCERSVLASGL